jgi:hypothetical protein
MNEPGGRLGFRVVRGRLPETCHGVLVELGSSRGASPEQGLSFAQNRLDETCTSHESCARRVNHELVEHRGRRNDEVRGLPSVLTERRPLKREACVVRGRQLLMPHESLNDLSDHLHKFLRFQNAR